MSESNTHKAGFVSIVGKPNVGKSTLMNAMVGEKLSIITSKAQTTRHRIMGILNGDDFQIVYSDTPGIIEPKYELHKSMMRFVNVSLEDADIILFVTDIYEQFDEDDVLKKLKRIDHIPVYLIINKIDMAKQEEIDSKILYWKDKLPNVVDVIPVSAKEKFNTDKIFSLIRETIPVHPPYYDKEDITDKSERFFASEIIREKIFLNYKKEIPYSSEVVITSFKEEDKIIRIGAEIYVERDSQKGIIIGPKGMLLKKVATEARLDMELFFGKKVFLETFVKVEPDWRSKEKKLDRFGYNNI
ncbi:MAG TPA: GTPase Era [Cytophagaceae bacterium]|jgi:GTP-binding protein Era|nr:GTPase Era [Cytophagaceae bacterium]